MCVCACGVGLMCVQACMHTYIMYMCIRTYIPTYVHTFLYKLVIAKELKHTVCAVYEHMYVYVHTYETYEIYKQWSLWPSANFVHMRLS